MRAVVVVDAAGSREIPRDLSRYRVHSVSKETERLRAGLPEAERGLRIADVPCRPARVCRVAGHIQRRGIGIHCMIAIEDDAHPQRVRAAWQRTMEPQLCPIARRELELAEKKHRLVHRMTPRTHLHRHTACAVALSLAPHDRLRIRAVIRDAQGLQRDRLTRDA